VRLNEGLTDTPIQLQDITATLNDLDGPESLSVTIASLPVGSVLADGSNTFTSSSGNTVADVTGWDLTFLSLLPPAGFEGQFNLTVNAISMESSNSDTATTSMNFTVVVMNNNVAPVAVSDASVAYSVDEGENLSIGAGNGVLVNDSDADNDSLS